MRTYMICIFFIKHKHMEYNAYMYDMYELHRFKKVNHFFNLCTRYT